MKTLYDFIVERLKIKKNDKGETVPEICPACGGKVTIRTGKDGRLKLECINYYEKGRTCPNNYNIEDYIIITY